MAMGARALENLYFEARREGELMAGAPSDLQQRATVYHHLYRRSRGNHVFPLLAAHGALWGKGYFALGMKVGRAFSLLDLRRPDKRRERLAALAAFADAFRDINRRVCVEVYATYHFTADFGEIAGAECHVDPQLLDALNRCHHVTRREGGLTRAERGMLFEAFFRWEQRVIVAPSVDAAVRAFTWSRIRELALRPDIRFAYIPRKDTLRFRDFADVGERIEKGLRAYEIAENVGWERVEAALCRYGVLPANFLDAAEVLFDAIRERLLAPPPGAVAGRSSACA
jgi:hypothetical protein